MAIDYSKYADLDPEIIKNQEALNEELGFKVPEEDMENADIWETLFRTLRQMYAAGFITREQSDQAVTRFYDQNLEEREALIQRILKLKREHEVKVDYVQTMASQQDMLDEFNEVVELLPEELREEFIYYIKNGEELPTSIKRAAESTVDNDEIAQEKLNKLLNKDFSLDVKNLPQKARTLSPADLQRKFNVQANITSKQAPEPSQPQQENQEPKNEQ